MRSSGRPRPGRRPIFCPRAPGATPTIRSQHASLCSLRRRVRCFSAPDPKSGAPPPEPVHRLPGTASAPWRARSHFGHSVGRDQCYRLPRGHSLFAMTADHQHQLARFVTQSRISPHGRMTWSPASSPRSILSGAARGSRCSSGSRVAGVVLIARSDLADPESDTSAAWPRSRGCHLFIYVAVSLASSCRHRRGPDTYRANTPLLLSHRRTVLRAYVLIDDPARCVGRGAVALASCSSSLIPYWQAKRPPAPSEAIPAAFDGKV